MTDSTRCAAGAQLRLQQLAAMRKTQSSHTLTLRVLNAGTGYMVLLMMSTRYTNNGTAVSTIANATGNIVTYAVTATVWAHSCQAAWALQFLHANTPCSIAVAFQALC